MNSKFWMVYVEGEESPREEFIEDRTQAIRQAEMLCKQIHKPVAVLEVVSRVSPKEFPVEWTLSV